MSNEAFSSGETASDWCTSVENEFCPGYRRFLALADGVPPPSDASLKPALDLSGRVVLVSCFVDRPRSVWAGAEIREVFRSLDECAAWLVRQASRYAIAPEIGNAPIYYHTEDPSEDPVPIGFQPVACHLVPVEAHGAGATLRHATRWVARLGFADIVRFFGHVQRTVEADNWVVLFHTREAGRSYAVPARFSLHACVEFVMCFPQEAILRTDIHGPLRPDPAVFAHEILHLFGATDKYDVTSLDGFPPGSVTERDIMRAVSRRLNRLRIDPLTAAEVGWKSEQ